LTCCLLGKKEVAYGLSLHHTPSQGWPICVGISGRFTLDWVADLARNTQRGL